MTGVRKKRAWMNRATRRSRSRTKTLTEATARAAPYTVRNWARTRRGMPGIHDQDGVRPYQSNTRRVTGIVRRKWIASPRTVLTMMMFRGNRSFLMSEALLMKAIGPQPMELASHCPGNWPAMRNRGYG